MLNLDFSSVQGFDPIPEGDYVLKIDVVEEKTSKAGNPLLNVTFVVQDGEFSGRKIFENYTLTEKSLWKLKQLLSVIGIESVGVINLDLQELVGRTLTGVIILDEYNGEERNKIKNHKKAPQEYQLL